MFVILEGFEREMGLFVIIIGPDLQGRKNSEVRADQGIRFYFSKGVIKQWEKRVLYLRSITFRLRNSGFGRTFGSSFR